MILVDFTGTNLGSVAITTCAAFVTALDTIAAFSNFPISIMVFAVSAAAGAVFAELAIRGLRDNLDKHLYSSSSNLECSMQNWGFSLISTVTGLLPSLLISVSGTAAKFFLGSSIGMGFRCGLVLSHTCRHYQSVDNFRLSA